MGRLGRTCVKAGSSTERTAIDHPGGHRQRRPGGISRPHRAFPQAIPTRLAPGPSERILPVFADRQRAECTIADWFVALRVV